MVPVCACVKSIISFLKRDSIHTYIHTYIVKRNRDDCTINSRSARIISIGRHLIMHCPYTHSQHDDGLIFMIMGRSESPVRAIIDSLVLFMC